MNDGQLQDQVIRVLVVDNHNLFRTALSSALASHPDIEVVAEASGGWQGVRLADELEPDVVLIDLRMPDLEGPEATREILERRPSTCVVGLTVELDDADAVAAGACGCLAKDTPIDGIVDAVHAAAQGVAWLSPRAAEVVLGRVRREGLDQDSDLGLTEQVSERELEVLRLIARGVKNAEIAEALAISPHTVKNHVSNILLKLGLPSRVQAAV
jgi:two-component system, NarL family, response regulator LiaR